MANRNGRAVRFNENTVRTMGRVATGVRGMRIDGADDAVVGMVVVNDPEEGNCHGGIREKATASVHKWRITV